MKKLLLTLITLLFIPTMTLALDDNTVINLKTGNAYILELNARPLNLQNSNPKIVLVEAMTDIDSVNSSLVLTTYQEGIAYITFKLKNKQKTIKLLIDNKAEEDKNLLIIDKVEDKKAQ